MSRGSVFDRRACRKANVRHLRTGRRTLQWLVRTRDRVFGSYASRRDEAYPTRERNVTSRSDRFVAQDKRDALKQRNRARV